MIVLTLADGSTELAAKVAFNLPNQVKVTYGQVNGLAADFYGTTQPISDGTSASDKAARFVAAFNTLAAPSSRQPGEANQILAALDNEVKQVDAAIKNHIDPSVVYANLPDLTLTFQEYTLTRPSDQPSYLGLAKINWDHFGIDARTAYNTGHGVALAQAASSKSSDNLMVAYTMNAFADHFLEDSFSAGHLRTPRRQLHSTTGVADLCAKYMHDEDNAIGLDVVNPQGDSWHAYGDKRLLDTADTKNAELAHLAVQTSADEIYKAWTTGQVPSADNYGAWQYAPTLESAAAQTQALQPLFLNGSPVSRRADITKRRDVQRTTDYWYGTTAALCAKSGLWTYPITLGN